MRYKRGFTLVEILIVVIILGILAAIVIPQYSNASSDARGSSLGSTLQSLRGQLSLFATQHGDASPSTTAITNWQLMLTTSSTTETTITNPAGTNFGPYVPLQPVNPANGQSAVGSAPSASVGWVYTISGGRYTIQAVNTTGTGVLTY